MLERIEDREYSFNAQTGEIIAVYEYGEMKPMTKKEDNYYKWTKVCVKSVKSRQELDDFISACVDRRRMVTYNGTKDLHNMACGQAKREKEKIIFTLPQYKTINKLIKAIVYSNIFVGAKSELSKVLGCKVSDIKRSLYTVRHLVRVQEAGMVKGQIKVFVHPAYGFRWESGGINSARRQAVYEWLRSCPISEDDVPLKDFEMSESFTSYLTGKFIDDVSKNQGSRQMRELGIF